MLGVSRKSRAENDWMGDVGRVDEACQSYERAQRVSHRRSVHNVALRQVRAAQTGERTQECYATSETDAEKSVSC